MRIAVRKAGERWTGSAFEHGLMLRVAHGHDLHCHRAAEIHLRLVREIQLLQLHAQYLEPVDALRYVRAIQAVDAVCAQQAFLESQVHSPLPRHRRHTVRNAPEHFAASRGTPVVRGACGRTAASSSRSSFVAVAVPAAMRVEDKHPRQTVRAVQQRFEVGVDVLEALPLEDVGEVEGVVHDRVPRVAHLLIQDLDGILEFIAEHALMFHALVGFDEVQHDNGVAVALREVVKVEGGRVIQRVERRQLDGGLHAEQRACRLLEPVERDAAAHLHHRAQQRPPRRTVPPCNTSCPMRSCCEEDGR